MTIRKARKWLGANVSACLSRSPVPVFKDAPNHSLLGCYELLRFASFSTFRAIDRNMIRDSFISDIKMT